MNNPVKISIIIPHKNNTPLLQRCLDSVPISEEIEIIIVDDCSDNLDKEKFPGVNRSNTKIIFSEKGITAGGARNRGIEIARGEWLMFVDADDFLLDKAIDVLLEALTEGTDILYFKVKSVFSDTLLPAHRGQGVNDLVDRFGEDEMLLRVKHVVPWGKIFNASFVHKNKFTFDEVPASNDVMFSVTTGFYANIVKVLDEEVYCITMNRGSISNTKHLINNRSRFQVALRYNQFLRDRNLNKFQNSIRPFVLDATKFGLKEVLWYMRLIRQYGDSLFYNLNLSRSINSFLRMNRVNKTHNKYVVK